MRNLPESDLSAAVAGVVDELAESRRVGSLADLERIEADFVRCVARMLHAGGPVFASAISGLAAQY